MTLEVDRDPHLITSCLFYDAVDIGKESGPGRRDVFVKRLGLYFLARAVVAVRSFTSREGKNLQGITINLELQVSASRREYGLRSLTGKTRRRDPFTWLGYSAVQNYKHLSQTLISFISELICIYLFQF